MHPIRTWASLCGIKAEGFPPLGHSVPVAGVAASAHPYAQSFEGTPALQVTTSLRSSPGVPSTRLSRTGTSRRRVVGGSPRRAPLPPSHGEAAASRGWSPGLSGVRLAGPCGSGSDQRDLRRSRDGGPDGRLGGASAFGPGADARLQAVNSMGGPPAPATAGVRTREHVSTPTSLATTEGFECRPTGTFCLAAVASWHSRLYGKAWHQS